MVTPLLLAPCTAVQLAVLREVPGKSSSKTRVQLPDGPTGLVLDAALAVMLSACVAVSPPESVTLTVKLEVPAAPGYPR